MKKLNLYSDASRESDTTYKNSEKEVLIGWKKSGIWIQNYWSGENFYEITEMLY